MNAIRLLTVTIVVVLAAATSVATAQTTVNWTGANGSWSVAGNWTNEFNSAIHVVPAAFDQVNIVNSDGARTVTYNVNAPSLGLVTISSGLGGLANTLSILNNNTLTAGGLFVGGWTGGLGGLPNSGRGAINQADGTVAMATGLDLVLAHGAGSTGTYTLSGGSVVASQNEFVGLSGFGTFNQSGGVNTLNFDAGGSLFSVGHNNAASGVYNLSLTGQLIANTSEYIGYSGIGTFNQTGGSNALKGTNSILYLGHDASSSGNYTLSAGTLATDSYEIVGYHGLGKFLQNGGSNSVAQQFQVGHATGSKGEYTLSAGALTANLEFIGVAGDAAFNQSGGTNSVNVFLKLGTSTGSSGAYAISGGSLTVNGDEYVGDYGSGRFHQSGGVNNLPGSVWIAAQPGSTGSFTITGGSTTLSNASVHVGGIYPFGGNESPGGAGELTVSGTGVLTTPYYLWVYDTPGTSVHLDGGTINASYLNFHGNPSRFHWTAGTLHLTSDVAWDAAGSPAFTSTAFGSELTLGDHQTLQITGNETIGGSGGFSLRLSDGSKHQVSGGITLSSTGSLTLSGGALVTAQLAGSPLTLERGKLMITNQAMTVGTSGPLGNVLDLADDLRVDVTLGITNQGLVTGGGQIGGVFHNAAAGELRAEPGRSLTLTGSSNSNAGQIHLLGGVLDFTHILTNNAGALISGNGSLIADGGLTNNGTMNFAGTANIVGDVTNAAGGKIISGGGGATIFYDDVVNNGEIRTSSNGFTVFFGGVAGTGTFTGTGTVNFEGDLSPGSSPAAVSFAGDVAIGQDATLRIELGGTTPGSQYDQLKVADDLALDGNLLVSLINGFAPSVGQSFNILDWGVLEGAFSSLSLPALAGGRRWDASQLYSSGVLAVLPAFEADFDEDGEVDANDLVSWRAGFGVSGSASHRQGDADGDGNSDGSDFLAWQRQLGGGPRAVGTSATVPEPPTLTLLILAANLQLRGWSIASQEYATRRHMRHVN